MEIINFIPFVVILIFVVLFKKSLKLFHEGFNNYIEEREIEEREKVKQRRRER